MLRKAKTLQNNTLWDKRRRTDKSAVEIKKAFLLVEEWVQKRLKGTTAKGAARVRGTTSQCDVETTQIISQNNIRHKNLQGTVEGMWHLFFGRPMDFSLYSRTQIGEISEAIPALIKVTLTLTLTLTLILTFFLWNQGPGSEGVKGMLFRLVCGWYTGIWWYGELCRL